MHKIIKAPKAFIRDHIDRGLETPAILGETSKHYLIAAADPAMAELVSDAEYYTDISGPDAAPPGLKQAAKALLAAIEAAALAECAKPLSEVA